MSTESFVPFYETHKILQVQPKDFSPILHADLGDPLHFDTILANEAAPHKTNATMKSTSPFAAAAAALVASFASAADAQAVACPANFAPVCGSDGMVYRFVR